MPDNNDNKLTTGQTNQEPILPQDSPYDSPFSSSPPPSPQPEPVQQPIPEQPPAEEPVPQQQSADLPPADLPDEAKKTSHITAVVLAFLAIFAVAGAAAFFLRSQFLKTQLQNLLSAKQNQQTENPTPTPTTTPLEIPQTSPTPTPVTTISPQATFPYLDEVIALATEYADENQLLMITTDNTQSPYQIQIKYWFRTKDANNTNKYFYILRQPAQDLELLDKQIYVTPDNNIPDLKAKHEQSGLGIDLNQALAIAKKQVLDNSNIEETADSISSQYIETQTSTSNGQTVLLWQLVYNYLDRTTPVVVQIDAINQSVIYANINYNTPQEPETTPSSN